MKLIIEVETTKIEDMVEAVSLLNTYVVKIGTLSGVEAPKEEKTTPSMAEPKKEAEDAPKKDIDLVKKRTRRTKAEIEAEKAKKEVVPEEDTPSAEITLSDLKDIAKEAVERSNREKVKAVIGKYAPKLTEVSEEDYSKLAEALKGL